MSHTADLVFGPDVLRVNGVVDFTTVAELKAGGDEWLRARAPSRCRLDFGGIDRCNSAGVALLLGWLRTAAAAKKAVTLCNPPAPLYALLDLASLVPLVPLEAGAPDTNSPGRLP